jgi:cyclin-dependent kinase 7
LQFFSFLHQKQIIHRDDKPENILIDSNKKVRIIDFGLATESYSDYGSKLSQVYSLFYRQPEFFFNSKDYGTETNMWAIGCVFVEMFPRKALFKESRIFKCLLQSQMY